MYPWLTGYSSVFQLSPWGLPTSPHFCSIPVHLYHVFSTLDRLFQACWDLWEQKRGLSGGHKDWAEWYITLHTTCHLHGTAAKTVNLSVPVSYLQQAGAVPQLATQPSMWGLQGTPHLPTGVALCDTAQLLLAVGQLEAHLLLLHAMRQVALHPIQEVLMGRRTPLNHGWKTDSMTALDHGR